MRLIKIRGKSATLYILKILWTDQPLFSHVKMFAEIVLVKPALSTSQSRLRRWHVQTRKRTKRSTVLGWYRFSSWKRCPGCFRGCAWNSCIAFWGKICISMQVCVHHYHYLPYAFLPSLTYYKHGFPPISNLASFPQNIHWRVWTILLHNIVAFKQFRGKGSL